MARNNSAGGTGERVLKGTNFAIYTIIVMALVVSANYFARRYTHQWDLTPSQKYTLSPQSVKILKGLSKDVTIYVFDQEARFRGQRDLLGQYLAATPRVSVRYVDPNRDPALAKEYSVRSYGTIVVAAGDRHLEAKASTEEGITNALIAVLKGQKTIYFTSGHGERSLDGSDGNGYSKLKSAIENENDKVETLVLLQKLEIPSDCALLVVAGPRNDFLQQEVDVIQKYLTGGGRAMFLLDPGVDLPNLSKLLADYNVTVRNDLVIDQNPVARMFGTRPEMPLIIKYGSSPIVEPIRSMATLFPLTRSFEVGKTYKAGVTADSLCETTPESFGVAGFNPSMHEIAYRPGKDQKGPLSVAVSGSLSSDTGKPEGRFIALGTSLLPANTFLGFQGNRDLFMNMLDWLSSNEELISIRPKPPETQHLDVNAKQMNSILLRLAAIPLIIIIAGIVVWWGRR